MSFNYLEIDTVRLQQDAARLLDETTRARKALEEMETELGELNMMWKGKANRVFRYATKKDIQKMEIMLKEMEQLAGLLDDAGKEYVNCENEVREEINRINI